MYKSKHNVKYKNSKMYALLMYIQCIYIVYHIYMY
jgi:hypothetical protein